MGNEMKLKYRLWLWLYKQLPHNRGGKLIFEPYKGFIVDLFSIKELENQLCELYRNITFMSGGTAIQKEAEILNQIESLHNKIETDSKKWKYGERW